MPNSIDFRADQIQTKQIIVTGSGAGTTKLLIYGIEAQGSPVNEGLINTTYFPQTGIGGDVFLYVSGAVNTKDSATVRGTSVFGGDLVVSGSLYNGSPAPAPAIRGIYSHAEGLSTFAIGSYSHAEGSGSNAYSIASHAEGRETIAYSDYSHAEGYLTRAENLYSHAEGYLTTGSGEASHAEGTGSVAAGNFSHAEGDKSYTFDYGVVNQHGQYAHTEGQQSSACGDASHAEGCQTAASGTYSHAEGFQTVANGGSSHAEGAYTYTFNSGEVNKYGQYAHTEGKDSSACGDASHAEGNTTKAIGFSSHAEGYQTIAFGTVSHASGIGTIASGSTAALSNASIVQAATGRFNKRDNTTSLFVIGNGTGDSNALRGDIFRAESTGELVLSGGIRHKATYSAITVSLTKENYLVIIDTQSGSKTVYLPGITDPVADIGLTVRIRQYDTAASSRTLTITVQNAITERINGFDTTSLSLVLGAAPTGTNTNRSVTLTYMGLTSGFENWFVVETSTC